MHIPEAMRLVVMDAAGVTSECYDELKEGWFDDLGKPGVNSVSMLSSYRQSIWRLTKWKDHSAPAQLGLERVNCCSRR